MDSILKGLAQTDRDARMRAIGLLDRLKDEDSIDILTQVLLEDRDAAVRRQAVITLGSIGATRAIETLADVSLDDPDDMVRQTANSILAR